MYNLMIFIVLIFFIIYNFYKYNKEYFSNGYQDTELRAKLSHHGTNLSLEKPLLFESISFLLYFFPSP